MGKLIENKTPEGPQNSPLEGLTEMIFWILNVFDSSYNELAFLRLTSYYFYHESLRFKQFRRRPINIASCISYIFTSFEIKSKDIYSWNTPSLEKCRRKKEKIILVSFLIAIWKEELWIAISSRDFLRHVFGNIQKHIFFDCPGNGLSGDCKEIAELFPFSNHWIKSK